MDPGSLCPVCHREVSLLEEYTKCGECARLFHLRCVGLLIPCDRYGCGKCFAIPGTNPQNRIAGERPMPATPAPDQAALGGTGHNGAAADELVQLMRRQSTVLERLEHKFESDAVGSAVQSWLASEHEAANVPRSTPTTQGGHPSDPMPEVFNVTQARSSTEFIRCLEDATDQAAPVFLREPPPLPDLTGQDPLEWPAFITSYQETTKKYRVSDVANMERVRKACKGDARVVLGNTLLHSASLKEALDTLRVAFGDPEKILQRLQEDLERVPRIDAIGRGLQLLTIKIRGIVNYPSP